ncbi:MAG: LysR substrate-binding domain-containing protein, partial [Myxococcota bacterium]
LGVSLFHRTTRRVMPTRAGELLHQRLGPLLAGIEQALELPDRDDAPSGLLRVTTTADLGAAVVGDVLARYATLYPAVSVEVAITTRVVDLVSERFDAAVRVAGGALPDSGDTVARRIGAISIEMYASPRYLARRGTPRTTDDLVGHDLVGVMPTIPGVPGVVRIRCDDMFTTRAIVRSGGGIGLLAAFMVDAELAAGEVVRVLPEWVTWTGQIWLVTPTGAHPPPRVAAFRDLLLASVDRSRALGPPTAGYRDLP